MQNYKKDFPLLRNSDLVYLDSAATSHKPQVVIDSLVDFYSNRNASIHRGVYDLAEQATQLYDQARRTVADWINARNSSEVVFTRNATEGINMVAAAWGRHAIRAGDEIVLTELEHHANMLPWQLLAQERGATIRWIPVNEAFMLDVSQLGRIITKKTKLVALTACSNVVGPIDQHVVEAIICAAHAVGAPVCVDATQVMAHARLDVQALGADFLVFSGHKMFGPTGIGVGYVRQNFHEQMRPYQSGGGMVCSASYAIENSCWLPMPHLLEAGTPAIAEAIGLAAAIAYMQSIDFDVVRAYEASLMEQLLIGLKELPGIHILGESSMLAHGHLVSFYHEKLHAHDIAAFLSSSHIAVRAGHHCCQPLHAKYGVVSSVRISIALYTTPADIVYVLAKLKRLITHPIL